MTIETEPQGAIVVLNDEEIGATPVSTDFLWYGDYDVAIRKKGYETIHSHIPVRAPWYQYPPMDFVADVLWPGKIHDQHHASFVLTPRVLPERDELIERANAMRDEALAEEPRTSTLDDAQQRKGSVHAD